MTKPEKKLSGHTAWALAVGGMIGGGIYTLAGFILGVAGPLAWLSLLLGSLIALATGWSYWRLTIELSQEGVPIAVLQRRGHTGAAGLLTWWLLLIYVLAMAVYAFTLGQYLGRALGVDPTAVRLIVAGAVAALVGVNLFGVKEPAGCQIAAVYIELSVLAVLAGIGIYNWNPENLTAGVPEPSLGGVLVGMAATFIAFEGFEMLVYDVRELRQPRTALRKAVPAAILTVAVAYSLVTVGAASLVGASVLAEQKENALAVAGERAAGKAGLVIVTIAACASAVSAINATLFSVARLARAGAEAGLLPSRLARSNARGAPYFSIILLGVLTAGLTALSSLEALVQTASLAFLLLFGLVNVLALTESKQRSLISVFGATSAAIAAVIVTYQLFTTAPFALAAFVGAGVFGWGAKALYAYRRRTKHPPSSFGQRLRRAHGGFFRDLTPTSHDASSVNSSR